MVHAALCALHARLGLNGGGDVGAVAREDGGFDLYIFIFVYTYISVRIVVSCGGKNEAITSQFTSKPTHPERMQPRNCLDCVEAERVRERQRQLGPAVNHDEEVGLVLLVGLRVVVLVD